MITIISGTNRPGRNTRTLTTYVEKAYATLGAPAQVLDLADLPQEMFLPSSYERSPVSFQKFIDAMLGADGIVVVTPEYNGRIPGVLKDFIDMLPFPASFDQLGENGMLNPALERNLHQQATKSVGFVENVREKLLWRPAKPVRNLAQHLKAE